MKVTTPTTRFNRCWCRKHLEYLLFFLENVPYKIFLCDRDFPNSQLDINYILLHILIDWAFHICFGHIMWSLNKYQSVMIHVNILTKELEM